MRALTHYWRRYPPVHVSVAAYLGIGAQAAPAAMAATPGQMTAELGPSRGTFRPPIPIQVPIQGAVQTPAPPPES